MLSRALRGPATTEIDTLSLHDALPIFLDSQPRLGVDRGCRLQPGEAVLLLEPRQHGQRHAARVRGNEPRVRRLGRFRHGQRSEEHTSELQSLAYLVCRLLLETKNAWDA